MGLLFMVSAVCICFLVLLMPCAAMHTHTREQSSNEQANDKIQFSLPTLPRKLKLLEEAKVNGGRGQGSTSYKEQKRDASGKLYNKEQNVMHGSKGTWHEWVEGTDTSQFFTMDYSNVKRRRPIHNKSLPVGP